MTAHNPQLDAILDWFSTYAALIAAFPTPNFPVGTTAWTTDRGTVRWTGTAWSMNTTIDNLTANAGAVQAGATPLTASMNRVTTVASAGNSVLLPASAPGDIITVCNAAAVNAMNVFPNAGGTTTEKINALGANAAFSLGAGKTVDFCCFTAGQWHTNPLVP